MTPRRGGLDKFKRGGGTIVRILAPSSSSFTVTAFWVPYVAAAEGELEKVLRAVLCKAFSECLLVDTKCGCAGHKVGVCTHAPNQLAHDNAWHIRQSGGKGGGGKQVRRAKGMCKHRRKQGGVWEGRRDEAKRMVAWS